MNTQYLDRYQFFYNDGGFNVVPGIEIPIKTTDKYVVYTRKKDRLDKISQTNYSTPLFGWLILLANPTIGSIESDIPDNILIRVPFPLVVTLQDYKSMISKYNLYYGE